MFEWEADNAGQIWRDRRVTRDEAEAALHDPFQVPDFACAVEGESREAKFGMTTAARILFVVFTWRGSAFAC
jgi:uncharacterized DUF497 family protein